MVYHSRCLVGWLDCMCIRNAFIIVSFSIPVTRYVAIGQQSVVRLPEQVPVKLDCRPLAVLTFGNQLNLSSIEWRRNTIMIESNNTVRNVFLSPNNLCLLVSALTIRTEADNGTEALFTCRACRNDPPGRECAEFPTRLIASSKHILNGCIKIFLGKTLILSMLYTCT